jgi:hypothetical protein
VNKKTIILIISIVVLIVGTVCFISFGMNWLVSAQYNEKGISHFLVITIDKNQPREYIGELDEHKVFIENLNLEETNFRTINAEDMPIKEALAKNLVSIEEWRKYALKTQKDEELEILRFENYEIVINHDEYIIRPLVGTIN